ncbi:hypothetical protein BJ742DRAFT_743719 [Cladochytrium replicatum]|nr:hypothetical protein BJ742DRAFT_743719 [Cladochytrium replicatum]
MLLCLVLVVAAHFITAHAASSFVEGRSTYYGPWLASSALSELGYQPNDIGVGCSNGEPGGDPRWNAILAQGTHTPPSFPQNANTVWPKVPTVAVSQAVYAATPEIRKLACWNTVLIRKKGGSVVLNATIVDFCPTNGCLWPNEERARNLDIYGQHTWEALGGKTNESTMAIEVQWPESLASLSPAHRIDLRSASWLLSICIAVLVVSITL